MDKLQKRIEQAMKHKTSWPNLYHKICDLLDKTEETHAILSPNTLVRPNRQIIVQLSSFPDGTFLLRFVQVSPTECMLFRVLTGGRNENFRFCDERYIIGQPVPKYIPGFGDDYEVIAVSGE